MKHEPNTVLPRPDCPGTYLFVYHVDLRDEWSPTCDCKAGCLGRTTCHHITAAQAFRDGVDSTETRD